MKTLFLFFSLLLISSSVNAQTYTIQLLLNWEPQVSGITKTVTNNVENVTNFPNQDRLFILVTKDERIFIRYEQYFVMGPQPYNKVRLGLTWKGQYNSWEPFTVLFRGVGTFGGNTIVKYRTIKVTKL